MQKLIYSLLLGAFLTAGVISVQAAVVESSVMTSVLTEKDKDGKKKKKKKCCKKSNKSCSPEEKKACEEKKSMEEKAE